jgi:hypothetical protein
VIWGISPNLSLSSGNKIISQSGDSSMRENIDGITMNKIYYVRAFATNKIGTSYSNEISAKLPVDVSWMGPGGIVFYMFKEGENGYINGETHGLQAIGGPAVESGKFDCGQINLGTSTIIGAGKSNTDKIINKGCPTMGLYIGNSIIKLNANKYEGYSDWFIPSRDEYLAMIAYNLKEKQRKLQINTSYPIWTSSEADSSRAYSFDNNIELIKSKQGFNYYSVPIRAF